MRLLSGLFLAAMIFLSCLSAAAQYNIESDEKADSPADLTLNGRRTASGYATTGYAVRGSVVDAASNKPLPKVEVDLRALTGEQSQVTYSNDSGNFGFENLGRGSYVVEVRNLGYNTYSEQLDLGTAPMFDVKVALHSLDEGSAPQGGSKNTVSARELAIPQKARESMDKGSQLLAKNDYSGSIREFQRAIQAYPTFYEAYSKMGLAYMESKDPGHAEPALRKAIDLSAQKFLEPYVYLAKLLSDNNRFAEAETVARQAVGLNANSWEANAELGRALLGEHHVEEAEKSAETAVRLGPTHAGLYIMLINIHYMLNQLPEAVQDMDAYLKLAPNGPAADQVRTARAKLAKDLPAAQPSPPQEQAPTLRP